MKIIITGGAGFIGSTVAKFLRGHDILIIDNLKTGYIENIPHNCEFMNADCSDQRIIDKISEKYDVIIHIAGQPSKETSFDDVFYDLNANAKSTLVLLELCKKVSCKRFIFISTVCVYGGNSNPGTYSEDDTPVFDTFYSINKFTSENYIKMYKNIEYTIFRLFTCYGPGQSLDNNKKGMVAIYMNQFLNCENVIVKGSLDRYRDFVYVDDVARIISESIKNPLFYNQTLNLGTGIKTTIKQLLDIINKTGQFKKKIIETSPVPGDMLGCVANNVKLMSIIPDFKFTPLEEGITTFLLNIRDRLLSTDRS